MDRRTEPDDRIPLVVDLDGTFSKIDTLQEAVVELIFRHPLSSLHALLMLKDGPAAFKSAVADHVVADGRTLPTQSAVLEAVTMARREGRKVYLATAADKRVAEAIACSAGCFDGTFASENGINLKGKAKADCLVAAFGEGGFDYIGDAEADIPIWREARRAIISGASRRQIKRLSRELPNLVALNTRGWEIEAYFSAMRPHQWLKNILLFVPAFAAHRFDVATLTNLIIAFFSFNFGASGAYLINDMLDLSHDRAHPEKHLRPMAAGTLSLSHGAVLFFCLTSASIALALTLDWKFILILIGYFGLSISYSVYLKRKLMIDVVALAALYGIRVVAGGVVSSTIPSDWLVGFCFFIFLSLALVKRTTEMLASSKTDLKKIRGRGYRRNDLPIISAMMVTSGFIAVLVLALYINSPEVKTLYQRYYLLWGICTILTYWLGRLYVITERGEMRQDPVFFAANDWISLLAGGLIAFIFFSAI
jgi:4-hydroxybenzoate polyprenyltransferase